ncbi:hypothetical protein N431DRAFT_31436 [Stipitochalara longipes BDJ]|nr:hypothetical protein N431DRAFT_31436 [Stipitochalara longipes BDJ]
MRGHRGFDFLYPSMRRLRRMRRHRPESGPRPGLTQPYHFIPGFCMALVGEACVHDSLQLSVSLSRTPQRIRATQVWCPSSSAARTPPPRPNNPTSTASIVADGDQSNWVRESEYWYDGLTICFITTNAPIRAESKVALAIAPKMATGEADAVPRVGSKWSGCWAGCGKITAVGVSHRSGRIFCRSVDDFTLSLSFIIS